MRQLFFSQLRWFPRSPKRHPRRATSQLGVEVLEPRECPAIDLSQTGIATLFSGKGWITYSPALGAGADQATVEADFKTIRAAGFVGIVTYATRVGDITGIFPKLAHSAGLRIIAGLDLASDVNQQNINRVNPYCDAYVVGNETIKTGTTPVQLAALISQVKGWSNKPATTAESYNNYDRVNNPTIANQVLALGDWIFPNIQVWFDGFVSQCITRGVIQGPTLFNNIVTYAGQIGVTSPVVAHEFWWPTFDPSGAPDPCGDGSGPGATEANQSMYFSGSTAYSASNFGGNLRIVWGEYIDQTWKGPSVESHFGFWNANGTPKQVVVGLAGQYQDFANQVPIPLSAPIIAVASGTGILAEVKVFDAQTQQLKFDLLPVGNSTSGVRVAVGDVNGDHTPDIITVPGPGAGSVIQVFDGSTGSPYAVFAAITTGQSANFIGQSVAFGTNSSGTNLNVGFYVAAGDLNGDGFADVIIGFDGSASGPLVNIFSGKVIASGQDPALLGQGILASYNAFPPPGGGVQFNGGVRVAAGDIDGDGKDDVVAVPGIGGGPLVSVYSGLLLTQNNNLNNAAFIISFNAYPIAGWPGTGLFVAVGDIDHDGFCDIILGPGGSGGGTSLLIISTRALLAQFQMTPSQIDSSVVSQPPIALPSLQYAPPYLFPNGIRVGTADLNGDGFADILLGGGPGNGSMLDAFLSQAGGTTTPGLTLDAFGAILNGIFVAGG